MLCLGGEYARCSTYNVSDEESGSVVVARGEFDDIFSPLFRPLVHSKSRGSLFPSENVPSRHLAGSLSGRIAEREKEERTSEKARHVEEFVIVDIIHIANGVDDDDVKATRPFALSFVRRLS